MKVLMITSMFPAAVTKQLFGTEITDRAGWINASVEYLKKQDNVKLTYLVPKKADALKVTEKEIEGVQYCQIEYCNPEEIGEFFKKNAFDVIHIYGSEYNYIKDIYAYLPLEKTLFYIQGLIELYYEQYLSGLDSFKEMDFLTLSCIRYNAKLFRSRGEGEQLVYPNAKHVAGRTDWDKNYVDSVNTDYTYHYLSESMRDVFYEEPFWNRVKCVPNTIFMSQGNAPIKGLHMALRIIKKVKENYPNVILKIGGANIYRETGIATKLGVSYVSFLKRLIKEYDLSSNVMFLGMLSAEQVKQELLKANIFISPSSIENSPNSLQEAMLTGTPCISSDVGGVRSIVTDESQCLLYPFGDTDTAAVKIIELLKDKEKQDSLSKEGRKRALITTDRETNGRDLLRIYKEIAGSVVE